MEKFINLLLSNLSTEEICNILLSEHPIECEILAQLETMPNGIYKGAIGEKPSVEIRSNLLLSYDDKNIYPAFIDFLRKQLREKEIPKNKMFAFCMKNMVEFSKKYFYTKDTDEQKQNEASYLKFLEKYNGNSDTARDEYMYYHDVSTDETKGYVYPISKSVGVGDGAKCVERNATACNLMHFMGLETYLISGYINNNPSLAHTFTLYRSETTKNFCLVDVALDIAAMNVLPQNYNLERGFSLPFTTMGDNKKYIYNSHKYPIKHKKGQDEFEI